MSNKVVIKRDWLGRIVEVELKIDEVEPERKPILELLNVVACIFGRNGGEDS